MFKINLVRSVLFISLLFLQLGYGQNILISQGGTVNVNGGEFFYDAGGPMGNDTNQDFTITLTPAVVGQSVCVDFTSFISYMNSNPFSALDYIRDSDRLEIYDGLTITDPVIGSLQGDYSGHFNTGTNPDRSGQRAANGFAAEFKPGKFCASNADGSLTFRFINVQSNTTAGWVGEVSVFDVVSASCTVNISESLNNICIGETTRLTASGVVGSNTLTNDFNGGALGSGWTGTNGSFTFTSVLGCEPNLNNTTVNDGSIYVWMQNTNGVRQLTSQNFDVSNGGVLTFDIRMASDDNGGNGCESTDADEGVYLQYSTNNGANWTTFKLIFPCDEADFGYKGVGDYIFDWTKIAQPIPAAAQTVNTSFRWIQGSNSSGNTDSWGIDNVSIITKNATTLTITDLSTGTVLSTTPNSSIFVDVSPTTTTTYRATITDGVSTCSEDITITVTTTLATPTASVTSQPDCTTPTGTITVTAPVLGANEEYVVTGISPVVAALTNTTGTFTGLASGNYDVTVTNTVTGCTSAATALTVNAVPGVPSTPTATVTAQPTCTTPTGTITVTGPGLNINEEYVVTGTSPVVAPQSNTFGTFTGLASGDYDVTVTNTVTGCTSATTALTVNAVPGVPSTPTATVTAQPTCTTPTGTITVTGPGLNINEEYVVTGTSPVVAPQSNTFGTFTGLAPGDYDVIVTNTVTGCTSATTALTVNAVPGVPSTPTATVTAQPTCTTPTGTITVTGPGLNINEEYVVTGTSPVVAPQSNTFGTFTGLAPGDYDVTVINTVTGCTSATTALTVNAVPGVPSTPTATVTAQPTCTTPTGTITVTGPGLNINEEYVVTGTSPVVAPQSNTFGTFTGLAPGDYDVIVTNTVTGCTSATTALTVNAVPGVPSTPTATVTAQPTCTTPTGTITVTGPGLNINEEYVVTGTSPVVAPQSNTFGTFTGLAPGDYDVTVINTVTGCTSATTALTVNAVPGVPSTPTATVTAQPTCTTPTGTITVTGPGLNINEEYVVTGTSPVVAPQSNTFGTFTGLASGDYDVTVTNTVTGCTSATTALTVNAVPGVPSTPTATVTAQPTCTTPTGTITVTGPGLNINEEYVVTGTSPVVAPQSNTFGTFTGLAPGDYDVTVINTVTGCTSATTALTVNAVPGVPSTPTATVTAQPTCTTPTGTITVTGPGLNINEEYVVTGTSPVVAPQSNTFGTFTGLAPGDYDVTVTNTVTGCTSATTALTVNAVPGVPSTPTATVTAQPTCTTPTGTITVTGPGLNINEEYVVTGTSPVVAPQSNTFGTFTGLASGDYDVTVTNTVTGCTSATTALTVNAQPTTPVTPTANVTVQPDCTTATGTITITAPALGANEEYVVTGTAPVVAAQSNTTGVFTGLATGDYDVTVTNTVTGCTSPATALTVNAVPGTPVTPTANITAQPDCTTATGTITVTAPALGANEEYVVTGTFPVMAPQSNTTGTFANLAAGDYDVTVTNTVTGCASAATALTMNAQPTTPTTPTASVTVQPTCTTPTGTIVVTAPALGANEEYVVTGTSPVVAPQSNTTGTFANLATGDYDVTVTNTLTGCTSMVTSLIINSIPPSPTINGILDVCETETTQLTGSGTPNAVTPWISSNTNIAAVNNNGQVTGVAQGSTTITYMDDNNCTTDVIVQVYPILNAGTSVVSSLCLNGTPIDLFDELGGLPDVGGTWTGPDNLLGGYLGTFDPTFNNAGLYTYTVDNGVCGFDEATVEVTLSGSNFIYAIDVFDFSDNNRIVINVVGQDEYEFSIDGIDFQSEGVFDNLTAGSYTVIIRDTNQCNSNAEVVQVYDAPKFLTPNNDGFYDYWQIDNIATQPDALIYIFDRYGKVIAQISPTSLGWDGTYLGEIMHQTDYWFRVDMLDNDGNPVTKKGHFSLIKR